MIIDDKMNKYFLYSFQIFLIAEMGYIFCLNVRTYLKSPKNLPLKYKDVKGNIRFTKIVKFL